MIHQSRCTWRDNDGKAHFLLNGEDVTGNIANRLAWYEDQEDSGCLVLLDEEGRQAFAEFKNQWRLQDSTRAVPKTGQKGATRRGKR